MILGFTNKMCPPGVDQTCRLTQLWTMMVPALEEQYDLGTLRIPETYILRSKRDAFAWGAFDKLAQRKRRSDASASTCAVIGLRHKQSKGDSAIERLPAELLTILFANTSLSTHDLFSLGLSSQILWAHLISHLSLQTGIAPWAGTPLLCTGTYLNTVPQAVHDLLPEMKQQEIDFAERVRRNHRTKSVYGPGTCPARNFNWAARESFTDRSKTSTTQEVLQAFRDVSRAAKICACDLPLLLSSLSRAIYRPSLKKPDRGRRSKNARRCGSHRSTAVVPTWVLRNLNTSEYVVLGQRKAQGKPDDYFHVKGLRGLSLDKLLILRASYSSQRTLALPSAYNQVGSWAGHRFDIVHSTEIASKAAWRDVTAAVVQEAKVLISSMS